MLLIIAALAALAVAVPLAIRAIRNYKITRDNWHHSFSNPGKE